MWLLERLPTVDGELQWLFRSWGPGSPWCRMYLWCKEKVQRDYVVGGFCATSEFGAFGHGWSAIGRPWDQSSREAFIRFMSRTHANSDYILRKLADGRSEFDAEGTQRVIREHILQMRKEGRLSCGDARHEWDLVGSMDHREDFTHWTYQTELEVDYEWYWTKIPDDVRHFVDRVFVPELGAALQASLADPTQVRIESPPQKAAL